MQKEDGKEKKRRGRPPLPRDASGNILRGTMHGPKQDVKIDDQLFRDNAKKYGFLCCSCGVRYDRLDENFLKSNSSLFAGSGGFVPICRGCLERYFDEVVMPAFDQDIPRAVEFICGIFDWYYDRDIISMAQALEATHRVKGGKTPMIVFYGQRRNMKQFAVRGSTYLDKCRKSWEMRRMKGAANPDEDRENWDIDSPANLDDVDEEDVLLFGPGYLPEEYRYLREQYSDWTSRYDCQSKAQEEIFKNISIAQVNLRRAQQEGDQKRTNEAFRSLNDLMDSAKIKPKQKSDSALVDQNTFGTLIQKWENEEPIPEPKEEWKDVDGIKKYISVWFHGHLSKMFGLDNDNAREYEEEIAKYSVEPPRYKGEDDDQQDEDVLQKLKAMRGKGSDEPEAGDEA